MSPAAPPTMTDLPAVRVGKNSAPASSRSPPPKSCVAQFLREFAVETGAFQVASVRSQKIHAAIEGLIEIFVHNVLRRVAHKIVVVPHIPPQIGRAHV